jgi:hypothetical protein
LVWRGYLTGGIAALYETLSVLIDEHDLKVLLGDPRLEIHVVADNPEVAVLGALRHTVTLDPGVFGARLEAADDVSEFTSSLLNDAMKNAFADDVIEQARKQAESKRPTLGAPPPESISQTPPLTSSCSRRSRSQSRSPTTPSTICRTR